MAGAADRAVSIGRGEVSVGEFPDVELDDAPGLVKQSAGEAALAWADYGRLVAEVTMPWGETYDGYTLVNMYLVELAGHSWDLATSIGPSGLA